MYYGKIRSYTAVSWKFTVVYGARNSRPGIRLFYNKSIIKFIKNSIYQSRMPYKNHNNNTWFSWSYHCLFTKSLWWCSTIINQCNNNRSFEKLNTKITRIISTFWIWQSTNKWFISALKSHLLSIKSWRIIISINGWNTTAFNQSCC